MVRLRCLKKRNEWQNKSMGQNSERTQTDCGTFEVILLNVWDEYGCIGVLQVGVCCIPFNSLEFWMRTYSDQSHKIRTINHCGAKETLRWTSSWSVSLVGDVVSECSAEQKNECVMVGWHFKQILYHKISEKKVDWKFPISQMHTVSSVLFQLYYCVEGSVNKSQLSVCIKYCIVNLTITVSTTSQIVHTTVHTMIMYK